MDNNSSWIILPYGFLHPSAWKRSRNLIYFIISPWAHTTFPVHTPRIFLLQGFLCSLHTLGAVPAHFNWFIKWFNSLIGYSLHSIKFPFIQSSLVFPAHSSKPLNFWNNKIKGFSGASFQQRTKPKVKTDTRISSATWFYPQNPFFLLGICTWNGRWGIILNNSLCQAPNLCRIGATWAVPVLEKLGFLASQGVLTLKFCSLGVQPLQGRAWVLQGKRIKKMHLMFSVREWYKCTGRKEQVNR